MSTDLADRVARLERDLADRNRELALIRSPFDQALVAYFNITNMSEPAFHELLDRVLAVQRPANRERMQFSVIDRERLDLPSVKRPSTDAPEELPRP